MVETGLDLLLTSRKKDPEHTPNLRTHHESCYGPFLVEEPYRVGRNKDRHLRSDGHLILVTSVPTLPTLLVGLRATDGQYSDVSPSSVVSVPCRLPLPKEGTVRAFSFTVEEEAVGLCLGHNSWRTSITPQGRHWGGRTNLRHRR